MPKKRFRSSNGALQGAVCEMLRLCGGEPSGTGIVIVWHRDFTPDHARYTALMGSHKHLISFEVVAEKMVRCSAMPHAETFHQKMSVPMGAPLYIARVLSMGCWTAMSETRWAPASVPVVDAAAAAAAVVVTDAAATPPPAAAPDAVIPVTIAEETATTATSDNNTNDTAKITLNDITAIPVTQRVFGRAFRQVPQPAIYILVPMKLFRSSADGLQGAVCEVAHPNSGEPTGSSVIIVSHVKYTPDHLAYTALMNDSCRNIHRLSVSVETACITTDREDVWGVRRRLGLIGYGPVPLARITSMSPWVPALVPSNDSSSSSNAMNLGHINYLREELVRHEALARHNKQRDAGRQTAAEEEQQQQHRCTQPYQREPHQQQPSTTSCIREIHTSRYTTPIHKLLSVRVVDMLKDAGAWKEKQPASQRDAILAFTWSKDFAATWTPVAPCGIFAEGDDEDPYCFSVELVEQDPPGKRFGVHSLRRGGIMFPSRVYAQRFETFLEKIREDPSGLLKGLDVRIVKYMLENAMDVLFRVYRVTPDVPHPERPDALVMEHLRDLVRENKINVGVVTSWEFAQAHGAGDILKMVVTLEEWAAAAAETQVSQ